MKIRFFLVLAVFGCFSLCAALPDFGNSEAWTANSSGEMTISMDHNENAVCFKVKFAADEKDRWAYPIIDLPDGIPADAGYLSFEIKAIQQQSDAGYKCALVMFGPQAGSAAWQPSSQWQPIVIDLKKSRIKCQQVMSIQIGANPQSSGMTLYLRNVAFSKENPVGGLPVDQLVHAEAPFALFVDGDKLNFTVKDAFAGLRFNVLDRRDRVVVADNIPADGALRLAPLPRGYYRLTLAAPDRKFQGACSFAVLPDPAGRRNNPESPYAMMTGLGIIDTVRMYPAGYEQGVRDFVKLCRLTGLQYVREILNYAAIEKSRGAYDWKIYGQPPELFAQAGIRVSAAWQNAPAWAHEKDGSLPNDLKIAYSFGKMLAETYRNKIQTIEFWNEPDGTCKEGAWEFAAMTKAAYLGLKAGNPEVWITNGSLIGAPAGNSYGRAALSNDLAGYFDIFNYHIYEGLPTYPEYIAEWKKLLVQNGCAADIPIWITENGTEVEGNATVPTKFGNNMAHSPSQEMVWAEFVPKSQLLQQSLGVARTFTFVLPPMNERAGVKAWGLVRRDFTAKPGLVSFATLTDQLAAAEYLGQPDLGPGIRAFLFRQPDNRHTLAFWSESELDLSGMRLSQEDFCRDFSLPVKSGGTLVDIFGTPEEISATGGRINLTATRQPAYFTGTFELPIKVAPVATGKPGAALADYDKTIVLRIIPRVKCTLNAQRNLLIYPEAQELKMTLQIANFSNEVKRGHVTSNKKFTELAPELELQPFEIREIDLTIVPEEATGPVLYRFSGTFNNRPISCLQLPVLHRSLRGGTPLTGSCDPSKWRQNSSGNLTVTKDETEQAVRFDVTFAPGADRWVFPEFLPEESLAGMTAISFEIKVASPKSDNHLVMFVEGRTAEVGKDYRVRYQSAEGVWKQNFVFSPVLYPEKVKQIRIGFTPRTDSATFWIRNLKVHFAE